MKRILAIFFFSVLVFISGCIKPGHDHDLSGSWKIQFYWDEQERTNLFSDYFFMFNTGG